MHSFGRRSTAASLLRLVALLVVVFTVAALRHLLNLTDDGWLVVGGMLLSAGLLEWSARSLERRAGEPRKPAERATGPNRGKPT